MAQAGSSKIASAAHQIMSGMAGIKQRQRRQAKW